MNYLLKILSFCALLCSTAIFAQPSNDNCADAETLVLGTACVDLEYTSVGATDEATTVAEDPSCGFYQGGDVWFNFTVPASGNFRIDLSGNNWWSLYSGACGSFSELNCSGSPINYVRPDLAGEVLYIRAFRFNNANGSDFDICVYEISPPANDNCANATQLILGNTCEEEDFSSIESTAEDATVAADPSCGFYQGGDVWFKFTVPASGNFRIDLSGNNWWSLYSGACGSFSELNCSGSPINYVRPDLAGEVLYIRAFRFNNSNGSDFDICVYEISPPANDNCANATQLILGTTCEDEDFSSIESTAEDATVAADPSCGFYQGGDVWYKFEVPASGNFRIDISGNWWTAYTGSCGAFTELTCGISAINFVRPDLAGQTLYIRAFRFNSPQGTNGTICVFEITPPSNDNCSNATILSVDEECIPQNYSNQLSTAEAVSIAPDPTCGFYQGGDTWFVFDAPASGQFRVDISSTNWALYEGSCGAFTELFCDNTPMNFNDPMMGGETFYIRTYRFNSAQGTDFELCVKETEAPSNDNCANATEIAYSDTCLTQAFSSQLATAESEAVAEDPACGFYQGGDIWFQFQAPPMGKFTVNRPSGAQQFAFYTGSCGDFTEIFCNGDNELVFDDPSLGGETIFIRAFRFNSRQGSDFELCVVTDEISPNDDCADAIELSVSSTTCDFSYFGSYNASDEGGSDPSCGVYQGDDVWFEFVVPDNGKFAIELENLSGEFIYSLYSGDCGNPGIEICENSPGQNLFEEISLAGEMVKVRVWNNNSSVGGEFGICVVEVDCSNAIGGQAFIDECGDCVEGSTGLEACVEDCNGEFGGTAFVDNCGTCVEGSTGLEPCEADCNGEFGGTAFIDNCGDCVEGSTGSEACVEDCNGEFGGTAFVDNCGTCVEGSTGVEPCEADCNGEFGGTAFLDNCGDCVEGSTGLEPCEADCNGEFGGTAFIDNCGDCVEGSTGSEACVEDCNGEFGGTAFLDNCGTCVEGSTGVEPCEADCNGEFGGTAFIDNCGDCVEGSTGLEACVEDCNGEFGGTAFLDNCGTCVEGSTGLEPCEADCNGEFGGTAFLDNCGDCVEGSTGLEPCEADCNGEFGGTAFIDNCGDCVEGSTGSEACVEDCNGEFGGTAFLDNCGTCVEGSTGLEPCEADCNGEFGGTAFIDNCGDCVEGSTGLEACVQDCNGEFGGTAFLDNCGTCVEGSTGIEPCETDCNGDFGGTAFIDNCGDCVEGSTGLEACVEDCNGEFGGTAFVDNCGTCVEGSTGVEPCETDCNGEFGGTAFIDNCGDCVEGSTGLEACVEDCNGEFGGTAFVDNCGTCVEGSTGVEPCETDCNGEFGGTAFIDNCGDCVEGSTGLEACTQDCNGEFGGTAFLDNCGTCVEGSTGIEPCEADCNGEFGGTAFLDNCGTCVEGSTGLEPCEADCNGEFGGTAFIDNCGDCVEGSTGLEACVEDCNGEFGGTAFVDNCGTCVEGSTGVEPCETDCNGEFGGTAFIDNCGDCVEGSTGIEPCLPDCNGDFGGTAFFDLCDECVEGNTGLEPCCPVPFPALDEESLTTTINPNNVVIGWESILGQVGCQIQLRAVGETELIGSAIRTGDIDSFIIWGVYLSDSDEFEWRVRCGCSKNPVVAGPFTSWQYFSTAVGSSATGANALEVNITANPNPTADQATVIFTSEVDDRGVLAVFDLTGKQVAELYAGDIEANQSYRLYFDPSGLPNGVYICRYTGQSKTATTKIMVAR